MWYFQYNNQQNGPNDSEVIKALLAKQTLTRDTLVWKEGMTDWCRLADTELASLLPMNLPPPINQPAVQRATVQPPPIKPPTTQSPPSQPSLSETAGNQSGSGLPKYLNTPKGIHTLWLWSVILMGVGIGFIIYGGIVEANQESYGYGGDISVAAIVGLVLFSGGAILWWILFYKCWAAIQDSKQPTTPGKAVGFMFIPLFNYYWQFIAILGLAKQLNYYCKDRSIAAIPIDERLALIHCILFCTLWIPYLNIITGIIFTIVFVILWESIAKAVALIIASKSK